LGSSLIRGSRTFELLRLGLVFLDVLLTVFSRGRGFSSLDRPKWRLISLDIVAIVESLRTHCECIEEELLACFCKDPNDANHEVASNPCNFVEGRLF
jgi:hypothetical protein